MAARGDYPLIDDWTEADINGALDEIDWLRSWDGLMSVLDEHYPADVFTGVSGDPGPRVIALLREITAIRKGSDGH